MPVTSVRDARQSFPAYSFVNDGQQAFSDPTVDARPAVVTAGFGFGTLVGRTR